MSRNTVQLAVFTYVNLDLWQGSSIGLDMFFSEDTMKRVGRVNPKAGALFVATVLNEVGERQLPEAELRSHESIAEAAAALYERTFGWNQPQPGRISPLRVFDDPNRVPSERVLAFPNWTFVEFEKLRFALGGPERIALELVSSQDVTDWWKQASELGNQKWDGVSRFGARTSYLDRKTPHRRFMTNKLPGHRILASDHDDIVFFAWRALRHAFDERVDPFMSLKALPLGPKFRLSRLQELYDAVRGQESDQYVFRRLMNSKETFIRRLDESSNDVDTFSQLPGKPAALYAPMYYRANS